MYNIVHFSQNHNLVLKSCTPGVYSCIGVKRCHKYYFTEKKFNEFHDWIYKHPHVVLYKNVSDTIHVK